MKIIMCDFVNLYLYQFWHIFIYHFERFGFLERFFLLSLCSFTYDKIAIDESIHFTLIKSFARLQIKNFENEMHICQFAACPFSTYINVYPNAIHHIMIVSKEIVYTINSNIVISLFGFILCGWCCCCCFLNISDRNAKRCNKWLKKKLIISSISKDVLLIKANGKFFHSNHSNRLNGAHNDREKVRPFGE